jgi:hypothetical protein
MIKVADGPTTFAAVSRKPEIVPCDIRSNLTEAAQDC